MNKQILLIAVVIGAGCADRSLSTESAPNEGALGITRVDVEESETMLSVRGSTADRAEIANLELRVGTFYFDEFESEVHGRQLTVVVNGHEVSHESAGMNALRLPAPHSEGASEVSDFLSDPRVAPVLARWGIEVDTSQRLDFPGPVESGAQEVPFDSCSPVPSAACRGQETSQYNCKQRNEWSLYWDGYTDTCLLGNVQLVCCEKMDKGGTQNAASRLCGFGSLNPCGAEGSNGCTVCWSAYYPSMCTVTHNSASSEFECWDDYQSHQNTFWDHAINISYN